MAAFVISDNKRVVFYRIKPKSIRENDFQDYIIEFRKELGHKRQVAMICDNISFHASKKADYLF
jgi:hypothetical protein